MSVDGSGSSSSPAVFNSPLLSGTGAQCRLEFYYYSSNTVYSYLRISHQQDVNKKPIKTVIWYKSLPTSINKNWMKGWIGLGNRPPGVLQVLR